MKRARTSYIYSKKHGNLLVHHDGEMADCPIKECGHTETDTSRVLDKLCKHIRIVHKLDYSTLKPEE